MKKSFVLLLAVVLVFASNVNCETPQEIFLNETYYSGFINITENSDIFYWWFPSLTNPDTDPLVFWLTGGPGCSSEVALFYENGKRGGKSPPPPPKKIFSSL